MKFVCSVCGYVYDEEKEGTLFSELKDNWICPICTAPKSVFEEVGIKEQTPIIPQHKKKFVCSVCGYVYDEENENTLFNDLPDTWVCPICNAAKSLFKEKDINISESPHKKRFVCSVCGYVYDEEKEDTLFSDLPNTWVCPICNAPKSLFKEAGIKKATNISEQSISGSATEFDEDLKKLSDIEMSALFSNLQRGSEKHRDKKAEELFTSLSKYYKDKAKSEIENSDDILKSMIDDDIRSHYPGIRKIAEDKSDRGTLRAITWGEKVSNMLLSLIDNKAATLEKLKTTSIWVCTICGFVYIGQEPPLRCPVCKVPGNKFEKMEGRN